MNDVMRKLRKNQGLSQSALARLAGISRASVQRYEANDTVPSVDRVAKIAQALGTTIDNLIGDTKGDEK